MTARKNSFNIAAVLLALCLLAGCSGDPVMEGENERASPPVVPVQDPGLRVDNGPKEELISLSDVGELEYITDDPDAEVVSETGKANPKPVAKKNQARAGKERASGKAGAVAAKGDPSRVSVDNGQAGEKVRVGLVSWRDLPFRTVEHQTYDFSCGSAAVATLMTYVYDMPTSEQAVFEEMFAQGDQSKIRRDGFSMLDMSNYLKAHGLEAKGFKITENAIEQHRLPFIALVNNNGYNHFVVVKTMDGGRVLVGDPTAGSLAYTQEDFGKIWNGLALIVVNEADKARRAFANQKEWSFVRQRGPRRGGNDTATEATNLNPMQWQIAPTTADILPAAMMGLVSTPNSRGGS